MASPTGTTRWTGGIYSHEHRYFIKYPTEYNNSRILQSLVVEDTQWRHLMGAPRFRNWPHVFLCLDAGAYRAALHAQAISIPEIAATLLGPDVPAARDR